MKKVKEMFVGSLPKIGFRFAGVSLIFLIASLILGILTMFKLSIVGVVIGVAIYISSISYLNKVSQKETNTSIISIKKVKESLIGKLPKLGFIFTAVSLAFLVFSLVLGILTIFKLSILGIVIGVAVYISSTSYLNKVSQKETNTSINSIKKVKDLLVGKLPKFGFRFATVSLIFLIASMVLGILTIFKLSIFGIVLGVAVYISSNFHLNRVKQS